MFDDTRGHVSHPVTDRDANTDLMRASAIGLVLAHHLAMQMDSPWAPGTLVLCVNRIGVYGVDLFFVLSGWLIGGLYWREKLRLGSVDVPRFWVRRWCRTLPPYFIVLVLVYAASLAVSSRDFDWRYLLFLQNYQTRVDWFPVSWSLCVEEHFYLLLPLLLMAIHRLRVAVVPALLGLAAISPLARLTIPPEAVELAYVQGEFGFSRTATHLRFEGLLMGVLLAYLRQAQPAAWARLARWSMPALWPLLAAALTIPWWNIYAVYYAGYTLISLLCCVLLVALVRCRPLGLARLQITKRLALCSYSVYLTHLTVIRIYSVATGRETYDLFVDVPLVTAACLIAGYLGYRCIELPAMRLRDRYAPKRV